MIADLASLVFLSYNRPEFLAEAIETARSNAGYPLEIIVHDDGSSDPAVYDLLNRLRGEQLISRVILNPPGHNQGVGEAVRVGFGAACGDVLIKADQDLIFEPDWLKKSMDILWNVIDTPEGLKRVGALGLFHYSVPDPRFQTLRQFPGWQEVTDFCGSAFLIPRDVYEECGPMPVYSDAFAEDTELKQAIQSAGYLLALPDEDLCRNQGFGIGPSTVVVAEGTVQKIHHGPITFG